MPYGFPLRLCVEQHYISMYNTLCYSLSLAVINIHSMNKLIVVSAFLLLCPTVNAKGLAEDDSTQVVKIQPLENGAKLSGATFAWQQSSTAHWRGFKSFRDVSPNYGGTVMTYVTFSFSEYLNLVTVRVETVPVVSSSPDSRQSADIYTKNYTYELKGSQVIIDGVVVYDLSEDGRFLTIAGNAGYGFAQKLVRR